MALPSGRSASYTLVRSPDLLSLYWTHRGVVVDDGTGLLDCAHTAEEHKSKRRKLAEDTPSPPQDPVPVAVIGDFVKVVGRAIPKHGSRQLVVSEIGKASLNLFNS